MAREQLGTAPSINAHTATKAYVDTGKPTGAIVGTTDAQTLTNKTLNTPNIYVTGNSRSIIINDQGGALKLGRNDGGYSAPYIDFNAGVSTTDYDSRIQAISTSGVNGGGELMIVAKNLHMGGLYDVNTRFQVRGNTNQHAGAFTVTAADGNWCPIMAGRTSSTGAFEWFLYNGSVIGGIGTTNGSTVYYNTSSDYRLKENVVDIDSGLDTISALRPVEYDWKLDGSRGEGFIAHELQEVIPEAVVGEKDAVDKDGNIVPQGVDFGKIVPHLVAAIQELTTRLEAAEARIAQLEGNASG